MCDCGYIADLRQCHITLQRSLYSALTVHAQETVNAFKLYTNHLYFAKILFIASINYVYLILNDKHYFFLNIKTKFYDITKIVKFCACISIEATSPDERQMPMPHRTESVSQSLSVKKRSFNFIICMFIHDCNH